jgi:hypothetical protein
VAKLSVSGKPNSMVNSWHLGINNEMMQANRFPFSINQ